MNVQWDPDWPDGRAALWWMISLGQTSHRPRSVMKLHTREQGSPPMLAPPGPSGRPRLLGVNIPGTPQARPSTSWFPKGTASTAPSGCWSGRPQSTTNTKLPLSLFSIRPPFLSLPLSILSGLILSTTKASFAFDVPFLHSLLPPLHSFSGHSFSGFGVSLRFP